MPVKEYTCQLESIDPALNRARRYELRVEPGLFGWHVTTWRGRIGRKLRRMEAELPTEAAAAAEVGRLLRRRIAHGYRFVD